MTRHMFISTQNYWFSRLASLTSVMVLAIILAGTYIRISNPNNQLSEWLELIQPYLTGILGIVIIFLTGSAWYLRNKFSYKPFIICLALVMLALGDGFINRWTSKFDLKLNDTLPHLLINLVMLSLTWWISSITRPNVYSLDSDNNTRYRLWAWLGLLFIFTQIVLGAWVSTSGAEFVCTDFPYCNGQLFPHFDWSVLWLSQLDNNALITIHMMHRFGGIITGIYICILSILLIFNRQLCEMGFLLFLLLISQMILAIVNIVWLKPLWAVISHDIVAIT